MIKRSYSTTVTLLVVLSALSMVFAQQPQPGDQHQSKHESMQAMNERGDKVMGFDHLKTTHHFLLKTDGGLIKIETNDANDKESRDQIRGHMRHIARMFSEGNFSAPMLIHAQNPPGSALMKELKGNIKYEFGDNERGAQIRISTSDPDALKAIHDFLRFQIKEHMTGDSLEVDSAT
jgi:hypothetical protein